jgi:hypothetical protein
MDSHLSKSNRFESSFPILEPEPPCEGAEEEEGGEEEDAFARDSDEAEGGIDAVETEEVEGIGTVSLIVQDNDEIVGEEEVEEEEMVAAAVGVEEEEVVTEEATAAAFEAN